MILCENERVKITGEDEVIFSVILFILNLFLDARTFARQPVDLGIKYFRDPGLPLDLWLFKWIMGTWDTKLACGTPAGTISFPDDKRDPADGDTLIHKMRRREIWGSMCTAVGCQSKVSAPPWVRNTPEIGGALPSGDGMLAVMADLLGPELLHRLPELTKPDFEKSRRHETDATNRMTSGAKNCPFHAIFGILRQDPEIEVGFRPRQWISLERP
jgi:hypothetical protein